MLTKIQDADLAGKGVVGQSDVPGLTAEQMQRKVEEIVRDVAIVAINRLCDELGCMGENSGAGQIGVKTIGGLACGNTVQAALEALKTYADELTIAAGAGDMLRSVYDPGQHGSDVFGYADAVEAKVTALEGTVASQGTLLSGKADAAAVTEALAGKAALAHEHSDYAPLSGAAFSGAVTVVSSSASESGGVRNVYICAQTPASTLGQDGDLCFVLE